MYDQFSSNVQGPSALALSVLYWYIGNLSSNRACLTESVKSEIWQTIHPKNHQFLVLSPQGFSRSRVEHNDSSPQVKQITVIHLIYNTNCIHYFPNGIMFVRLCEFHEAFTCSDNSMRWCRQLKVMPIILSHVSIMLLPSKQFVSYHCHRDSKFYKITVMIAITSDHMTLKSCDW